MKKIVTGFMLFLTINHQIAVAQNTGIGTTTPQTTLDVKGNFRTGGGSTFLLYDSVSGKFNWTNSNLFVPVSQYLIKHSASLEGLYYNSGQLEYRNQTGNPVFLTNWQNGNGYFSGDMGIGTITPQHKLHLFTGASGTSAPFGYNILALESSGNINMSFLTPDGSGSTIWFSRPSQPLGGGIFYNTGVPDGFIFRANNAPRMVITNAGNIGIGLNAPAFPLSFSENIGDKISLSSNSANSYGFGIQNSLLQIHTDISAADIAFGYGSSSAFTEKMRIKGSGNVGIGTTSPNAPLGFPPLLGKKITLYPGATGDVGFAVAGNRLQIYSDNPNADVAIGYDAAGTFNERFAFKPNGALAINGNAGSPGQVITSGGSGTSQWASPTNILYNNTAVVNGTGPKTFSGGITSTTILPGMSYTFSVSTNAKVIVSFNIPVRTISCFSCGASSADIYIDVDNSFLNASTWEIGNNIHFQLSGSYFLSLAPGTHTIELWGYVSSGPDVEYGGLRYPNSTNNMIVQVIPQ